ncbi:uncharacterized protein LOC130821478 [Amaranthus tricolor]|uniref:uncharacterized protein LOC130821478 n=1 Tax=Amaranthus tricolor TaxID=29722 RepID=UPI00258BDD0A|nr:uncharacterized protein LOC130821478 [Amaranthus tricolor]
MGLPVLPMEYWGERCIRKIVGLLRNVIKIDNATKNKDRLMYARALVEMDIRKGLPDEVFFTNEYDELVKQAVQYDWKPLWCHQCQQLGHQSGAYKPKKTLNPIPKKPPRRGWVKKGSQKDHTKAQRKHHDNSETRETMKTNPTTKFMIRSFLSKRWGLTPSRIMNNILTWNFRGLNKANKQAEVAHFIANHNISLFSLLETKVKRQGISALYQRIYPSWCITHNLALHKGGRIIVAWRAEEMKVDIRFVSSQIIHLIVNPNVCDSFDCSFVYGATDKNDKGIMLTELENIDTTVTRPWIVIGDFNYKSNLNKRIG